uniref:Uncharacterized protein n=1 Tax=Arundo donax TaxID=35708 RepID=A0A0A8ZLR3_ARUDO
MSAGIESKRNRTDVTARAPIASERKPAEIPPKTPPMSNTTDRIPEALCDKNWPATAATLKIDCYIVNVSAPLCLI